MMMHLVSHSVNPHIGLAKCIKEWKEISFMLRERPRRRSLQSEIMPELLKLSDNC
jgi:hypothetical protein